MPKQGTRIREKLTLSRKIELMNIDRKAQKMLRKSVINRSLSPLAPTQSLAMQQSSIEMQAAPATHRPTDRRPQSRMMGPPGISSTFIGHIATLVDIEESEANGGQVNNISYNVSANMNARPADVSLPSTVVVTTSYGPPFFNMNSKESILANQQ